MPDLDLITAAVFNNAVWCDAVCQALGCDTDFVDDLWINSGTSPPFYPNAISLTRDGSEAQSRRIREMVQAGLPEGWTEKDAFETLNLAELGFRVLFEAEWIALPPERPLAVAAPADVAWLPVTTDAGIVAWEAAWRAAQTKAPGETHSRVFMPDLLDDPDIVLLGAQRQRPRSSGSSSRTGRTTVRERWPASPMSCCPRRIAPRIGPERSPPCG